MKILSFAIFLVFGCTPNKYPEVNVIGIPISQGLTTSLNDMSMFFSDYRIYNPIAGGTYDSQSLYFTISNNDKKLVFITETYLTTNAELQYTRKWAVPIACIQLKNTLEVDVPFAKVTEFALTIYSDYRKDAINFYHDIGHKVHEDIRSTVNLVFRSHGDREKFKKLYYRIVENTPVQ